MRIVWIVGDDFDSTRSLKSKEMKEIGPLWGTPNSWRKNGTDNVVTTDQSQAYELLQRAFQAVCNFYIPLQMYAEVGRPAGVKVFEGTIPGQFDGHSLATVFALASQYADTVLLIGIDLSTPEPKSDRMMLLSAIKQIISSRPEVQWVCLNHINEADLMFKDLPNLWFDSTSNLHTLFS